MRYYALSNRNATASTKGRLTYPPIHLPSCSDEAARASRLLSEPLPLSLLTFLLFHSKEAWSNSLNVTFDPILPLTPASRGCRAVLLRRVGDPNTGHGDVCRVMPSTAVS